MVIYTKIVKSVNIIVMQIVSTICDCKKHQIVQNRFNMPYAFLGTTNYRS